MFCLLSGKYGIQVISEPRIPIARWLDGMSLTGKFEHAELVEKKQCDGVIDCVIWSQ